MNKKKAGRKTIRVGIAAGALVAMAGTAFGERLVVRTDFNTPAEWTHRGIGGYDFLPAFHALFWAGSESDKAPLPMYRECVHILHGRGKKQRSLLARPRADGEDKKAYARWTEPAERFAKPYTFEEAAGKLIAEADAKWCKGYPFFFSLDGDNQVYLLDESYPLADCASYRAWRAAHPNFCGVRTLVEYDTQAMFYRAFSGDTKDKTVVAQMHKGFPFPPAGTPEDILNRDWASKWVRESVRRERGFYFGETNLWSLCSCEPSVSIAMCEGGVAGFDYEATTQSAGSWTVSGAFARGAARQFGVPFGWYIANWITAYDRAGKHLSGENSMAITPMPGYAFRRFGGASRSTIRRQATYGWLIGAAFVEPENWYHYHMEETEPGKSVPSAYAKDLQALCDRAKTVDRGDSYTPVALLVPVWGRFWRGYNADRWTLSVFGLTLEPPNQEQDGKKLYDLARRNGDESCFLNSPFGGIYDIIAPDATRNRANVQKTLGAYKAAFVVGDFRKEELPPRVFEDYAAAGGTLFVSGDKLAAGVVDANAAGVAFGKKTVPSGKTLFEVRSESEEGRSKREEGRSEDVVNRLKRAASGEATFQSLLKKTSILSQPYDIMLPASTPTATPLYCDENGNVLVWSQNYGKGRIVTVACDRMLPSAYAKCPPDWKSANAKLLAAAKPGFKFDLVHTLLKRIQDETMPVTVEGDVMWGVNKVKVKGEGEQRMVGFSSGGALGDRALPRNSNTQTLKHSNNSPRWLVWLFNNKGVKKFIGEPQELDASKAATVTVRCGNKSKTVTVGPGEIEYVEFAD